MAFVLNTCHADLLGGGVQGTYDRMDAMLGADIHPVDILLLWAAAENDTPKVAELLRAGADVSVKVRTPGHAGGTLTSAAEPMMLHVVSRGVAQDSLCPCRPARYGQTTSCQQHLALRCSTLLAQGMRWTTKGRC